MILETSAFLKVVGGSAAAVTGGAATAKLTMDWAASDVTILSGVAGAGGSLLFVLPYLSQTVLLNTRSSHLKKLSEERLDNVKFLNQTDWQDEYNNVRKDYNEILFNPSSWHKIAAAIGIALLVYAFLAPVMPLIYATLSGYFQP